MPANHHSSRAPRAYRPHGSLVVKSKQKAFKQHMRVANSFTSTPKTPALVALELNIAVAEVERMAKALEEAGILAASRLMKEVAYYKAL